MKMSSNDINKEYFRSYEYAESHELMLSDTVRTNAYRWAILKNYKKFYGKVVADIGAGTGILSIFCAQAGAKKVYAVEASALTEQMQTIVKDNKLESKVEVVNGKVEEVSLPQKVDIIVSEWMGYGLLNETMLPSVLHARDNWLKPGGLLFPDKASLYIAPLADPNIEDHSKPLWDELTTKYKVNLTAMIPYSRKSWLQSAHIDVVDPRYICAHAVKLFELDLYAVTQDDLKSVSGSFCLDCFGHVIINGFVLWFSVKFPGDNVLTTSPYSDDTHWHQTILYLNSPIEVEQGSLVRGNVTFTPGKKQFRVQNIHLEYTLDGSNQSREQFYNMDQC